MRDAEDAGVLAVMLLIFALATGNRTVLGIAAGLAVVAAYRAWRATS